MKILVVCFLLSTLGLTYAKFSFPINYNKDFKLMYPKETDKVSAALLQSTENDHDTEEDDDDDEDIATLQGVFNVLAQVALEKGKEMKRKKVTAQLWGSVGKVLWKVGKHYLKKRYCQDEEEVQAILQELIAEQGIPEEDNQDMEDGDTKALTELQTLFNALNKAEAKTMQGDMTGDDYAKAQGWWKKAKRWANKKAGGLTRKYLC